MDILTTTKAFPKLSLQPESQARTRLEAASQPETENKMVNPEIQKPQQVATDPIPCERPLLCKDILSRDQLCSYPNSYDTEFACTSESESGFTSDTESWSNHEEDDHDEFVLCLTSRGAQPLDSTSALCPPLPRRLSFKPLETTEDEVYNVLTPGTPISKSENENDEPGSSSPAKWCSENAIFRNDYFAVSESKIAGLGAFAATNLKYGDRILVETPLFIADSLSLFKEFGKLGQEVQELALSLHANEMCKPGTPKLQAIWMANCFSTGVGGTAGLFPIASRFNHSCRPKDNVEYTFNNDNDTLEMIVKAESISAGEELTISYGTRRTPMDLYFRYGFRCHCGACPGVIDKDLSEGW